LLHLRREFGDEIAMNAPFSASSGASFAATGVQAAAAPRHWLLEVILFY
jgi:hypothetical protein